MGTLRGVHTNERGGTIAFVAVSMVALLSMMALAIDLAMLHKARNEAQRAAEAASLAGASAFQDVPTGSVQIDSAQARALRLASANFVNGVPVDVSGATRVPAKGITTVTTTEATVVIIPDSAKVRTYVRRQGIGTWFARIFGKNSMGVQARAAAWASPASQVSKCVKPFAVPDIWYNPKDADQIWGSDETNWTFDPSKGSIYNPFDQNAPANNYPWTGGSPSPTQQTGYGSSFRNNASAGSQVRSDFGRPMIIKAQNPNQSLTSPFFYAWDIEENDHGANDYLKNITGCAASGASVGGKGYNIEFGDMVGKTKDGVNTLIGLDRSARWVPAQYDGSGNLVPGTGYVAGSNQANWVDSPRVIIVAFFDPNQIAGGNTPKSGKIIFNNFALLFLEGIQDDGQNCKNQCPVVARFLYYAQGTAGGSGGGPLARALQLVE